MSESCDSDLECRLLVDLLHLEVFLVLYPGMGSRFDLLAGESSD